MLEVNSAVRVCEPTLSDDVVVDAEPAVTATVAMVEAPSLNATEPGADDELTVAVSVTVAPCVAVETGLTASVVVVAAAPEPVIVYDVIEEVELAYAALFDGVNVAVREWLPVERLLREMLPVLPLTGLLPI